MSASLGSFSIDQISLRGGLVLAVSYTLVVLLPLAWTCWYFFGEGQHQEALERLRALATADPVGDAREAIRSGDLRMLTFGYGFHRQAPGSSRPWDTTASIFGYASASLRHGVQPRGQSRRARALRL